MWRPVGVRSNITDSVVYLSWRARTESIFQSMCRVRGYQTMKKQRIHLRTSSFVSLKVINHTVTQTTIVQLVFSLLEQGNTQPDQTRATQYRCKVLFYYMLRANSHITTRVTFIQLPSPPHLCATRSFLSALSFASASFLRMSTCLG